MSMGKLCRSGGGRKKIAFKVAWNKGKLFWGSLFDGKLKASQNPSGTALTTANEIRLHTRRPGPAGNFFTFKLKILAIHQSRYALVG